MLDQIELLLRSEGDEQNEAERAAYIEQLETVLTRANQTVDTDAPLLGDDVYDVLMARLQAVAPESPLLHTVWSEDAEGGELEGERDRFLTAYPMLSIQTVKSVKDAPVVKFGKLLPAGYTPAVASLKLNGHGVRVVWEDGVLVKATSRGRSTVGRSILRHAQLVLGETCAAFKGLGVVELRGEVVLPFSNLPIVRTYKPETVSAFTAVASMIRESASDEEARLLHFVFYDILTDQLEFTRLTDKYLYLQDAGFAVPLYAETMVSTRGLERFLVDTAALLDEMSVDYEYYTDGVVVAVDDLAVFAEMGKERKYRYGNLALKIGRWSQVGYSGVVERIEWNGGKRKLTPVAVLREPVLTATGNHVTNVPLFAPVYIWALEAYPGEVVHFKYGGEAGVVPLTEDGRLVTDKVFLESRGLALLLEELGVEPEQWSQEIALETGE